MLSRSPKQVHFPVSEDSAAGAHAGHWAMDALQRLVADWVASGKLRGKEVAAMSPPVHMRSVAAVREALRSVKDLWSVKRWVVALGCRAWQARTKSC